MVLATLDRNVVTIDETENKVELQPFCMASYGPVQFDKMSEFLMFASRVVTDFTNDDTVRKTIPDMWENDRDELDILWALAAWYERYGL